MMKKTKVKISSIFITPRFHVFYPIFSPQLDDQNIQNSAIERLHKRRHLLAGYCKLIIYNVIPMRHSICVIRYYVRVSSNIDSVMITFCSWTMFTSDFNHSICSFLTTLGISLRPHWVNYEK